MAAPSILQLVGIIQATAESHPSVKSFGTGERHDISLDGASKPVHVWLEQPFRRDLVMPAKGNKTRLYRLAMMVLDIPKAGDDQAELEAISRCDLIADWIVLKLLENPPTTLQIGNISNVMSLVEYGGDLWAGVRFEFDLITPMPIGACDVRAAE